MNRKETSDFKPPKRSVLLLRSFIKPQYLEEIEGDLEEVYNDLRATKSKKRANIIFLLEVLRLLKSNLIKSVMTQKRTSTTSLLSHNLKLSLRGFNRYKTSFLINITGLSTAIAAALIIFLWVNDEYNVDAFHQKNGGVFQVLQNEMEQEGIYTDYGSPFILSDAIKEALPQVQYAATVGNDEMSRRAIFTIGSKKTEADGIFASEDFFKVFSFPLIIGNENEVFNPENGIAISEKLAIALFGSVEKAVGNSLETNRDLYNAIYVVTGVFKNIPSNSSIQFDYAASHKMALKYESWLREWSADGAKTYISLNTGTNLAQFNQEIKGFISDKPFREDVQLMAYPFENLYLRGDFNSGKATGGRISYVRMMSLTGLFILVLACINFMNLATAQAAKRIKEVGVKKILGVKRKTLIQQFLIESFLITLLALIVALFIVALILPQVNGIVQKELSLFQGTHLAQYSTVILATVTLFAGFYPALYLSKFQSNDMLRGKLKRGISDIWLRKGLVVLQFSVSTLFVTGFLVLNNQIEYIRNVDLGYNRDNLVHFTLRENDKRQPFLNELNKIPNVTGATSLFGGSIADLKGSGSGFSWGNPNENEQIQFRRPQVGYSFFETLGIELLEGRTFSKDFQNENQKLVINKAAADVIGIDDIVGRTIMDGDKEKEVIGIVKNFKIQSLYEPLQPAIMRFTPNGNHFMVKVSEGNSSETIKTIEALYNQFGSEYPFNPKFVNDEYDQVYQAESKITTLSGYFTIVAILIACLGLFGLATFNTQRRIKEVGIRKILGSSSLSLVKLLSKDFIVLVIISMIIALPLSYLLADNWLNNFSLHYSPGPLLFFGVAGASLLLALITVGFRTLKAANINPVNCLRNE